jgi:hypothetical protein
VKEIDVTIQVEETHRITVGVLSPVAGEKPTLAYVVIPHGPTLRMRAHEVRALKKALDKALYSLGDNELEQQLEKSLEAPVTP